MRLILRWILLAVSVYGASVVAKALDLGFHADAGSVAEFFKLMIGVAVLAFLNATLGRILKFLTLPLSCITLGLFSLVVNAVVLMIAASLDLGFTLTGSGAKRFIAALVASIMISFINGVLGLFLPDDIAD
jgi:putative membrane protein